MAVSSGSMGSYINSQQSRATNGINRCKGKKCKASGQALQIYRWRVNIFNGL